MKMTKIKPNPNNPRKINPESLQRLKDSVEQFPKMMKLRPIVIDHDGMILGGNMRYLALKEMGWKEIPDEWVKIADELTPDEKRRFIIADNVSGGEWNYEDLAANWDPIELENWGLELPENIFEQPEAIEDGYEIPDEIETDIQLGDLFEIGEHRLLCGDSTDSDQVAKLMNGGKYNLVVTDPPYNVNYSSKQELLNLLDGGKRNTNDNVINREDYNGWIKKIMGVLELFHSDYNSVYVFGNAESLIGIYDVNKLHISNMLVWVKNRLVLGRQDYNGKHENIIYGWFNHHKWYGSNSSVTVFEDEILSDKIKTTVIKCDTPIKSGLHPTMKPILLIAELITNSSQLNEIVLDLFLGSGSTMVAAHQLNRKCYGMELEGKYCQVIVDRMRKLDPSIEIKRNGEHYD